jgi:hypothetical protein
MKPETHKHPVAHRAFAEFGSTLLALALIAIVKLWQLIAGQA